MASEREPVDGWTHGDGVWINMAGDSAEAASDHVKVGLEIGDAHTSYFTELPYAVLRALLAEQGLHIVDARDKAEQAALAGHNLPGYVVAALSILQGKQS